jgi:hypothetical protein
MGHSIHNTTIGVDMRNNTLPTGESVCSEEEDRDIPIRQGALLSFPGFHLQQ